MALNNLITQVLNKTVELDIETLGTDRGSGIPEVAVFDPATNTIKQFRVAPNLAVVKPKTAQDVPGFSSNPADDVVEHPILRRTRELREAGSTKLRDISWKDTIIAQVLMDESAAGGTFESEIQKRVKNRSKLTINQVLSMGTVDEFIEYTRAIQSISDDTSVKGIKQFEQGTGEGSAFLRRAIQKGGALHKIINSPFQPGRVYEDPELLKGLKDYFSIYHDLDTKKNPLKLQIHDVTMEQLFDPQGEFLKSIKGKVVSAANINFESKNLGAQLSILEQALVARYKSGEVKLPVHGKELLAKGGIRNLLAESPIGITDILPLSGQDVNKARIAAQLTGDMSGVFQPLLQHLSIEDGLTRTMDVLELSRIQSSYAQQLGISATQRKPNTLSVDLLQRLYGYAENRYSSKESRQKNALNFLQIEELHQGIGDTPVQAQIRKYAFRQTEALATVAEGGDAAIKLLQDASKGNANYLYKAVAFERLKGLAEPLAEQANVVARLARAAENLMKQGTSYETTGMMKVGRPVPRLTPKGKITKSPIVIPTERQPMQSLDQVFEFMQSQALYKNADFDLAAQQFTDYVNKEARLQNKKITSDVISYSPDTRTFDTSADFNTLNAGIFKNVNQLKKKTMQQGMENLASRVSTIDSLSDSSIQSYIKGLEYRARASKFLQKGLSPILNAATKNRTAMALGVGMTAVGAAGLAGDIVSRGLGLKQQRAGSESLRTMTYQRWLNQNSQFYGMDNHEGGFRERGVNSVIRKVASDFGSPYQGPEYSQYVMQNMELMRHRENYIRSEFANVHFREGGSIADTLARSLFRESPESTLIALYKSLNMSKGMISGNRQLLAAGGYIEDTGSYAGMSGEQKLFKVDLSQYKISVEDADTITLKRKGQKDNPMNSFFGLNSDSLRIRLAGIDAPETAHGDRPAQKLAEQSKSRLKAMLSQGNVELLIDPNNSTYGRQVGSLFVDGRNVQMEMIKRGDVKLLDFRKKGMMPQYDSRSYRKMSTLAMQNRSGIFSEPYYQALAEFEKKSGKGITYNTIVNLGKTAENSSLMSMRAIMDAADGLGMYTPEMAQEVADIASGAGNLSADYKNPILFKKPNAPHKNYIEQLALDNTRLMKTRGNKVFNKMQRSSGYDKLDKRLSIDTAGSTTSSYNKARYEVFDRFGTVERVRKIRKINMAAAQKNALRQMNASPIGHHRM